MKLEKVYAVEFMAYVTSLEDTVSDWDGEGIPKIGEVKYLNVKGPNKFLIKESDLDEYKKYGQGYRNITFVGWVVIK